MRGAVSIALAYNKVMFDLNAYGSDLGALPYTPSVF
jgi:hypothetical protein